MKKSRHFTTVDDWVTLNPEISNTEFRVYAIIKGKVKHGYGGVPETGLQPTASWVSMMSRGRLSTVTAHRALRGLAEKGVLRRLNNPKSGSAGVKYEFVVDPGEEYTGPLSVMAHATEVEKDAPQGVSFSTKVELSGHPSNGKPALPVKPPSVGLQMDEPDGEEPEFDMSGFDSASVGSDSHTGAPNLDLTPEQQEFAAALEQMTAKNVEPRLRLLKGQCERIAEVLHSALEQGWDPGELALRLASELNPKINMPEKFLIRKAADIGAPPVRASISASGDKVMIKGKMVDLGSYDMGFGHTDLPAPQGIPGESEKAPAPDVEGKEERLRRIVLRARQRENG